MAEYSGQEYRRYSAVLKECSRNFAVNPIKRPRGRVVIEVFGNRCQLLCSIKNLRPLEEAGITKGYNVWLLADENENNFPVYAGEIIINDVGVGESKWELEANNVNNSGFDIDSFSVMEIWAGFRGEGASGQLVLAGQLGIEEASMSEQPEMKKIAPFGNNNPYYQWWKFYPGYNQNLNLSSQPQYSNYGQREQTGDVQGQYFGGLGSKPGSIICANMYNGAQTQPVFQGHQLIGLQYEQDGTVKYLVHGIPGRFCLRDQPYKGTTGYTIWQPLTGQDYKPGDYGYWLIYFNPVTGEVVFPKKPTIPPDCDECNRRE